MHPTLNKPLQEYRIAKGWRIFIYLFMPPLTLLFLWAGLMMPFQEESGPKVLLWFSPIFLAMIALFIYGLLDTIKGRLQVHEDRLVLINPFKTEELLFTNIQGFRTNAHYTHIYSISGKPKQLAVNSYLGSYHELQYWLYQNFADLDIVEAREDEQRLLTDADLGRNEYERERRLTAARKATKILNGTSFVLGLWLMLFPVFYEIAIALALLFPLAVLLVVYLYKGLISLNEKKSNPSVTITSAAVMPSLGLVLRAILDFSLLEYSPLIPVFILLSLLPSALLWLGVEKSSFTRKREYANLLAVGVFYAVYGWGAATIINCLYDEASTPEHYEAQVLSKRSSSGKTTTYYLELESWGPRPKADEVTVTEEVYEQIEEGEEVDVYLKPGLLSAPWYIVMAPALPDE